MVKKNSGSLKAGISVGFSVKPRFDGVSTGGMWIRLSAFERTSGAPVSKYYSVVVRVIENKSFSSMVY
jgi:hypothetical protein